MTKKILVQNADNKFINNLAISHLSPPIERMVKTIRDDLYKTFYSYRFESIILVASLLNPESKQFILEYNDEVNIMIYDDINGAIIDEDIKKVCKILRNKAKDTNKSKDKGEISIPRLLNQDIFKADDNVTKKSQIAVFLDGINILPDTLVEKYLHPFSDLSIKMFNNSLVSHCQNLGTVPEKGKAKILQESEFYLCLTEEYLAEAWSCGCKVLDIKELDNLIPKKYAVPQTYQSYSNFIKNII